MRPAMNQLIKRNGLVGVEIGVWKGTNAKEMLDNLNLERLYLVDPHEIYRGWGFEIQGNVKHDYTKEKEQVQRSLDEARQVSEDKLKGYANVVWVRKQSHLAIKDVKEELDFVYIDANHTHDFVLQDIVLWAPKVKKGGMVSGHDVRIPGVARALEDYCKVNNIKIDQSENDWWFMK